jgi:hypothetical protein
VKGRKIYVNSKADPKIVADGSEEKPYSNVQQAIDAANRGDLIMFLQNDQGVLIQPTSEAQEQGNEG